MQTIAEAETKNMLRISNDPEVRALAHDTAIVKALTGVFTASLEIAEEFPRTKGDIFRALSKKTLSLSEVAEQASSSKGLQVANFMATQSLKTIGLTKLFGMTPGKAGAYLTLTMAEKVVSAAGLAEISKCKMAVASLATTTGSGALVCFSTGAFTLGIGCVAGIIAVAADAFNVYGQCHGD